MRLEAKDKELAEQFVNKNRRDAKVFVPTRALSTYKLRLSTIRGARFDASPEKKQQITIDAYNKMYPVYVDEDFQTLRGDIKGLIDSALINFNSMSKEEMAKINIKDTVLAINDCILFATLDGLKNLELSEQSYMSLHEDFFDMAMKLERLKSDSVKTPKQYFKAQRRKDAAVLRGEENGITSLMEKINGDSATREDVCKLYAEYQALSKRQANHTWIWRYFHKEENQERTALIQEMREALGKRLPEDTLNSNKAPLDIWKDAFSGELREAMNARVTDLAAGMGFDKYRDNPDELTSSKFTGTIKDLVKIDYRPNFNCLDDEMKHMEKLRNAVSKGLIFKNEPALKELVGRNYLRLGAAKGMEDGPQWEKYCAAEDQRFKSEHTIKDKDSGEEKLDFEIPEDFSDVLRVINPDGEKDKSFIEQVKNDTTEATAEMAGKISEPPVIEEPKKSLN